MFKNIKHRKFSFILCSDIPLIFPPLRLCESGAVTGPVGALTCLPLRCQARLLVSKFGTIYYGKKSLSYLSPVLWNTLDNDIKLCNVLTVFKKRVKFWKHPTCDWILCSMPNIKPMIMNNYVDDHWLDILHQ